MQKYNNERKVSTGNRVVRKMTKLHPCQNSLKFWLATMLRDNQENGQIKQKKGVDKRSPEMQGSLEVP